MDEYLKPILDALLAAAVPVVTGLVAWLGVVAKNWLSAKIENEQLKNSLIQLETVIEDTVRFQLQTVVAKLKTDSAFSDDAARKVLADSVEKVYLTIGDQARAYLTKQFGVNGDLKPYIETKIEAAVYREKAKQPNV